MTLDTNTLMQEKSLEVLEFPRIRQRLATFTSFSASRELALSLTPRFQADDAIQTQREAREADRLLALRPNLSLGPVRDARPMVEQAQIGGLLAPADLIDLLNTLRGIASLKGIFPGLTSHVPILALLAQELNECAPLKDDIADTIGPRGEVLDGASPMLGALRREVKQAHDHLTDRLLNIINSGSRKNMIQEPIMTQRGGRYVLPVKADFRGEFRGIVHDVSSSGATLFMEPLEIVELGNSWKELQIQEEREVERVLRVLSALVGEWAPVITKNIEIVARIDLALAKARYGRRVDGSFPTLVAPGDGGKTGEATWPHTGPMRFVSARHPLLSGDVVPLSSDIGRDFFVMVITGPNTGGKTVALKTIGLLCLMAQAGMPIPAAEGCVIPVFEGIYADIGDEQSIEQSLSTFSSHMGHIIQIIKEAGDHSLVLLDELGAGTDPEEGSALARAILSHILDRGITTVATTHHSELKAYAYSTPGVVNASVEFDSETLAPTYKLSVGLPGRSNAFAIAQRLGLGEGILEKARTFQSPSQLEVEDLLSAIQRERDRAALEGRAASERLIEAQAANQLLQEELEEVQEAKARMIEAARQEVAQELRDLRLRLRSATEELEQGLRELARDRLVSAAKEMDAVEETLEERRWQPASGRPLPRQYVGELLPGVRVWIKGLNQMGQVLTPADEDGQVEVQVGSFKLRAPVEQLEPRDDGHRDVAAPYRSISYTPSPRGPASDEVHLRGLRVEEALERLDTFLNEAILSGLPRVRVVHGKGTGTMRRAVREVLSHHPLVSSFATAPPDQGGEGVTVAEMAE